MSEQSGGISDRATYIIVGGAFLLLAAMTIFL